MLKKIIVCSFMFGSLVFIACTKKEPAEVSPTAGMDEMQIKNYKGPDFLEVVPAKSLGDVHIGDKMMALMKIGFQHDNDYADPENHMYRGDIKLYLVDDQVAQIAYSGTGNYNKVKLGGKDFPKSKVAIYMRSFFKNCEPDIQVKSGFIIYCEHKGIRIDYDKIRPGTPYPFDMQRNRYALEKVPTTYYSSEFYLNFTGIKKYLLRCRSFA